VDATNQALQSDPDIAVFAAVVQQMPDVIGYLDANKQYYIFAPSNDEAVNFLQGGSGLAKRQQQQTLVSPNVVQQVVEKEGDSAIPALGQTLITTLSGQSKYSSLGKEEGTRVVMKEATSGNGTQIVVSGLGMETVVQKEGANFDHGTIQKSNG
jgi:hypothetical protein